MITSAKTLRICSFVGAAAPATEALNATLRRFGTWVAQHGHKLICGGMAFGGMQTIGTSVLAANGCVKAITPQEFAAYEAAHTPDHPLLRRETTKNLHLRLEAMILQSDAFVAFPGGVGTVHEIMQVWADNQAQTYHAGSARKLKPMIIYNYSGFFDHLQLQMAFSSSLEYIKPEHLDLVTWAHTEEQLFAALNAL